MTKHSQSTKAYQIDLKYQETSLWRQTKDYNFPPWFYTNLIHTIEDHSAPGMRCFVVDNAMLSHKRVKRILFPLSTGHSDNQLDGGWDFEG